MSPAAAEIVAEPEVITIFASQGHNPVGTSPKAFDKYLKEKTVKWLTLAKEVNIGPV